MNASRAAAHVLVGGSRDLEGPRPPRGRVEQALRASPLFSGLDDEGIAAIARHTERRRYQRGERVWRAGEDAAQMAVIVSGLVKIVQGGGHGAIVALFGPHETFGELAVIENGPYSADAVAATRELEVLAVGAPAVRSTIESCPVFARAMERSLVAHGRALQEKIQIMSAGSVERRLAAVLRHLVGRFGDELEDGTVVLPVALSRSELASLVGTTIETTIRTMTRWQKAGLVSTMREGFVVHAPTQLSVMSDA